MARKSTRRSSSFKTAPSGTVRTSTWFSRLFFMLGLVSVFSVMLGFVWFSDHVTGLTTPSRIAKADGAASLTGGSDARLRTGVSLVEQRIVPRLLISGVNKITTAVELRLVAGGQATTYTCCIDIGRAATDTVGNANEVSDWVVRNRIKRLILITDNYHMPRSLFEVQRANPRLIIIPYPVHAEAYLKQDWWRNEKTMRRLGLEYGKLLVAVARGYMLDLTQAGTN